MKNLKLKIATVVLLIAGLFIFSRNSVAHLPECDNNPPDIMCPIGTDIDCCVVLDEFGVIIVVYKTRLHFS